MADLELRIAALTGDVARAAAALRDGADLCAADPGQHGATPLHAAVAEGHLALVQMLVARGAPLEARDTVRRTPAARTQVLHGLIVALSAYVQERYTPLLIASFPRRETEHSLAILKLLLEADASPGAQARARSHRIN